MAKDVAKHVYDAKRDGNIYSWIIEKSDQIRSERNGNKEAVMNGNASPFLCSTCERTEEEYVEKGGRYDKQKICLFGKNIFPRASNCRDYQPKEQSKKDL